MRRLHPGLKLQEADLLLALLGDFVLENDLFLFQEVGAVPVEDFERLKQCAQFLRTE